MRFRQAWLAYVLTGLLLAVYAYRFVLPILVEPRAPRADDFQDYLYAARELAVGGNPYGDFIRNHVPWDWSLSSGYLYPPVFAVLLVPLTWLSNDLAVRVWLIAIQLMVLASILMVYRVVGGPSRMELAVMAGIAVTFLPLAGSVLTGAMNAVLLLMLTAAWAFWHARRDVVSGVVIGGAAVFKVFPVALLPYLAWRRHWRLVVALLLTGLLGIGLCLLVTSWQNNLYYFTQMLPHLSAGTGYRENQSLAGLAARLCDPKTADQAGSAGWCGRAISIPAVLLVLTALLTTIRIGSRKDLEFGLAVAALPLISSVTWSFHLVILLCPITLLVHHYFAARPSRATIRLAILCWCFFSLAPGIHYALLLHPITFPGSFGWLSAFITWLFDESYLAGTLLLFALMWKAVRDSAADEALRGDRDLVVDQPVAA